MFSAKVLADSLNCLAIPNDPHGRHRLTTMELSYPRCVHSEFMTHRAFSRNAASSRAIPILTMISRTMADPFIPLEWGKNQPGMQATRRYLGDQALEAETAWLDALAEASLSAERLLKLGLHKQIVNRVLEPWQWITVIASGTTMAWENFFHLRCSHLAEPHIREVAYMARSAYDSSRPRILGLDPRGDDDDHLPLFDLNSADSELSVEDARKVSTGRCARVSYLTHAGIREVEKDITLHDDLVKNGHWSPFEHVATIGDSASSAGGNFGSWWIQYRKRFRGEACFKASRYPLPVDGNGGLWRWSPETALWILERACSHNYQPIRFPHWLIRNKEVTHQCPLCVEESLSLT